MEGFDSKGVREQVSAEKFPIEDILAQYTATNTEAALEELWNAAWDIVTSAADALYDGGYISNKTDWINEIMEEAANTATQVNRETEEGVDPTDTRPIITPPPATVLYIRHPSSVRPGTLAMLWVEGTGGQAPYSWDFVANNSGGTLVVQTDTNECLYTAGSTEASDTIKVTDANGVEATAQIVVSATAPVIAVFGPGEITVGGNVARLRASGGATPHTWSFHEQITNSTLSFTQTTAVAQSTASFTSGTTTGRDTVKVLETGGQIALHTIDVVAASPTDTEPVIHGATSAFINGPEVLLQAVGGETPMTWAVTGDGTLVDPADANDPDIVEMGELWNSMYGSGGSTRLKAYQPPAAATSDTITVTDADGDQDTHVIAVISEPVTSRPTIYGGESALEDQTLLLRVIGGTPPYTWEILTNVSGATLAEYDNDEDGNNHYVAGGTGGTVAAPSQDIVRVTDANGYTDDHTISVYDTDTAPDPFPTPDPFPPWWNEDYGYLQVNLAPAGAISAGARWRVDGGTWNESGVAIEGFEVSDSVNIQFKEVNEWTTPVSQILGIGAGANVASGVYNQVSEALSYFSVTLDDSAYYIGKLMKLTVVPRDAGANAVQLAATNVNVTVDAGEIHASTSAVAAFARASASDSQTVNIVGASDEIWFVWWPDGSVPASITITVELASDDTINGADTATVDASANVSISKVFGDTYIPETVYDDLLVEVKDGDGDECVYFEGNITLTPTAAAQTPLISSDGVTYAASITFAVGPTHPDRPPIYLKDVTGDVTITAQIAEDTGKTDTVVLSETPVTFEFGSVWDNANKTALVKDATAFQVEVTAFQGGTVKTDYAQNCTITVDTGTPSGNTILVAAWSNGVAIVSAMSVDWSGSPETITLTCTDDGDSNKTGSRTIKTDNFTPDTSEVCALEQSARYGREFTADGYPAAFNAANTEYTSDPDYDDDNYEQAFPTVPGFDCREVGKAEDYTLSYGTEGCAVAFGVALYYVAPTNFDDSDDLFAEIAFDNPAHASSVWGDADLLIGVAPTSDDHSSHSLETLWDDINSRGTLLTVPAASIPDGGTVFVDLGIKKSDLASGIPIQVMLRVNSTITSTFTLNAAGTDKWSRIGIASVTIKG
jgi:hypothetical protein